MEQENGSDLILEHFGVKGMKWGVRRTDAQLRAADAKRARKAKNKAESKAAIKKANSEVRTSKQIKNARERVASRDRKINEAGDKAYGAKSKKEAQQALKEMKDLASQPRAKSDIAIAAKMTIGESFTSGLIFSTPLTKGAKSVNRNASMRVLDDVKNLELKDVYIEKK